MNSILGVCFVWLAAFFFSASECAAQIRLLNNDGKNFVEPASMKKADWSNTNEMARVWASSPVFVPSAFGGVQKMTTAQLFNWRPKGAQKNPVIIYLHGCTGLYEFDLDRAKMFAREGYIVVALASFARSKYAKSCDQKTLQGGFYRGALQMRQYDVGYALERLHSFSNVDPMRLALVGLSEGGNLAATFKARNQKLRVSVRIIEGWTCHAGWPEWAGMNADRSERVLSLLGANDPWFVGKPWLQGDCGRFMNTSNGSRSIVYRSGKLASQHALLGFRQPRQDVLNFLKTNLGP